MSERDLRDEQYVQLLDFRVALRRFLKWSEDQAAKTGITTQQHQLLLAIKGHPGPTSPTIGEVAEYLLVRHHSVVELIDRAERADLVSRRVDEDDRRVVHLDVTGHGRHVLHLLSAAHLEELARLAPIVGRLVADLGDRDVGSNSDVGVIVPEAHLLSGQPTVT